MFRLRLPWTRKGWIITGAVFVVVIAAGSTTSKTSVPVKASAAFVVNSAPRAASSVPGSMTREETQTSLPAAVESSRSFSSAIPVPRAPTSQPPAWACTPQSANAAQVHAASAALGRRKAAAILQECNDTYRKAFMHGVDVKDTPAGVDWYVSTRIGTDAGPVISAINIATGDLAVNDVPVSMSSWGDDSTATISDIQRWYEVTGPRAGGDITADNSAQTAVLADLGRLDRDVSALALGK